MHINVLRCPVCRYSQALLTSHPRTSNSTRTIPFSTTEQPSLSTCSSCASTTNLWICLICGNVGCGRYGRAHAHQHYTRTTHLYALELETQRVWDYAGDGYVHRLIQVRTGIESLSWHRSDWIDQIESSRWQTSRAAQRLSHDPILHLPRSLQCIRVC